MFAAKWFQCYAKTFMEAPFCEFNSSQKELAFDSQRFEEQRKWKWKYHRFQKWTSFSQAVKSTWRLEKLILEQDPALYSAGRGSMSELLKKGEVDDEKSARERFLRKSRLGVCIRREPEAAAEERTLVQLWTLRAVMNTLCSAIPQCNAAILHFCLEYNWNPSAPTLLRVGTKIHRNI